MSHTPHELVADFPEKAERIHLMKITDPHFRKLAEEYHDVNRAIHRAETNVEPMAGRAETDLRKRRIMLKDELAQMIG